MTGHETDFEYYKLPQSEIANLTNDEFLYPCQLSLPPKQFLLDPFRSLTMGLWKVTLLTSPHW